MAEVNLTLEEYEALRSMAHDNSCINCSGSTAVEDNQVNQVKPKRKASASSKRYGKAFQEIAPRFKLKNGSWKKNGFRNAVRAAHKMAKK